MSLTCSFIGERNPALEERRNLLRQALQKVQYPVIQSMPFDVSAAQLLRAAKELGLEGVIAKWKGSIYEPGRSSGAWVKYKILRSQEFVIGGYTAGNPFDALIVGCYEDGKLKCVGKIRNGFVPHMRCAMMPSAAAFRDRRMPLCRSAGETSHLVLAHAR